MTNSERNAVLKGLLQALDLHGPGEGAHADRVAVFAVAIGEQLGLNDNDLMTLRYAATLHDVGKVKVPVSIVRKIGQLDESELAAMRLHAELCLDLVREHDWLEPAIPAIVHHHERYDGNGYPQGLKGEAIPLGARIIAVAESFDAMTFGTWRIRTDESAAVGEITAEAGTRYDPRVVAAFVQVQPLIQPMTA